MQTEVDEGHCRPHVRCHAECIKKHLDQFAVENATEPMRPPKDLEPFLDLNGCLWPGTGDPCSVKTRKYDCQRAQRALDPATMRGYCAQCWSQHSRVYHWPSYEDDWPSSYYFEAHVGRAFVEHVAESQSFGPWRPNSVALADFAEHGSGVVLCRLWPDATKAPRRAKGNQGTRAHQGTAPSSWLEDVGSWLMWIQKYLGVRSPHHFVLAHAETRKKWRPGRKDIEQPMRRWDSTAESLGGWAGLIFGVGSPSRSNLQPRMELFGDARMTAREANAIVQSAFPAAYEWLLKRWFGPTAVTDGAVLRRRLEKDKRRSELEAEERLLKRGE
eukprot:Skav234870  [mRNA]  locus=scaffold840:329332:340695:- [translate_table: standard]